MSWPSVGDAVEVRKLRFSYGGLDPEEFWVPATVVCVEDDGRLSVAYSDGRRESLRRGVRSVRRPSCPVS